MDLNELQFILNTFSFLMCGVLVMWMAAGFAMLEAGMVRTKNVSTILLKNIALFAIAGIMYYVVGYNLMYADVGSFFGSPGMWSPSDADFSESGGYAAASDWFFQMVFVATTASIVSGTLAERIKILPFLAFVILLTGVIYPIYGAWTWGGGWLSELGFVDFAGSTIVHSVGGWAALAGALVLGPRIGKYVQDKDGKTINNPMPASNLPLVTLGTFILWMGWFGFNGGSVLSLGTAADANTMANVFVNTTLAAAAGVVAALIYSRITFKVIDLTMVLNGALAGLVAITAGPDTPAPYQAMIIGAIGAILCSLSITFLDRVAKIDDVVGAISVHLTAGIWGTLVVAWTNVEATLAVQAAGVGAAAGLAGVGSLIAWFILHKIVGIRAAGHVEELGLDKSEVGVDAYPEFQGAKVTDYEQAVV